jgi:hypothetical protein
MMLNTSPLSPCRCFILMDFKYLPKLFELSRREVSNTMHNVHAHLVDRAFVKKNKNA